MVRLPTGLFAIDSVSIRFLAAPRLVQGLPEYNVLLSRRVAAELLFSEQQLLSQVLPLPVTNSCRFGYSSISLVIARWCTRKTTLSANELSVFQYLGISLHWIHNDLIAGNTRRESGFRAASQDGVITLCPLLAGAFRIRDC